LLTLSLFAQVAKVVALKGDAFVQTEGKDVPITLQTKIYKENVIFTKDNAKVQIIFNDNTVITIGKNSTFKIMDYIFDTKNQNHKAEFKLMKGAFRIITGTIGKIAPERFKLRSKTATIGIRGTQILSNVEVSGDTIYCTEGKITINSILTGKKYTLVAGEYVVLKDNSESGIIQKFDFNSIEDVDTKTKFETIEEQESTLEEFGVSIDNVTEDNSNETTTSDTNEQSTYNNNDTATYDAVADTDTGTYTGYIINGLARNDYYINKYMSKLGYSNISSNNIASIEFDKSNSNNNIGFKFYMDNLKTNYNADGSYNSTLSNSTEPIIDNSYTYTFKDGYYTSKSDHSNGSYVDDDIQWGVWGVTMTDTENTPEDHYSKGYWVIGNQTSTSDVQNLISGGTTATYNGFVLGETENGSAQKLFNAQNSTIKLTFDFGAKSIINPTGSESKMVLDSGSYTIPLIGTNTVTNSGFTFTQKGTGIGYDGGGQGKFYGNNAASVGGSFSFFETSGINLNGVFKATK
jgi:hypothetical protein